MEGVAARELALAVGHRAAALLKDAQRDVGAVRHKGNLDTDWVTAWDERVEALIVEGLRQGAPGTAILGEEGGASAGDGDQGRWLVDPIDGTVNFAHGLPIFGVSIGFERSGQVQAGVVLAPALGWVFAAARGHGATMNCEPLAVSRVSHLRQAMLVTGFPADRLTAQDNNYREWEHLQNVAGAVRRLGAACLAARETVIVPDSKARQWSIEYDPRAGTATVHLDNESATLTLKRRGKANAELDRFGVLTAANGGQMVKIYFDEITYTAGR